MQNEYNNSRHFKVSYKDTRNRSSYFKLYPDFTLVLEDRDNGQRATYLNSSIQNQYNLLYNQYLLRCIMYYLL